MRDLLSVAILTTALGLPVHLAVVEVAQAQSIQQFSLWKINYC